MRRTGAESTAAVIGGGPAGLMAAETLARAGVNVIVYDHMPSVGRKLLLAGRSGLNLTHSEPVDVLVGRYGDAAPRLEAALRSFDPSALRAWSADLGEPTFIGTSRRVFPSSMRATPLLRAWLRRLDGLGVTIETRVRWTGWADEGRLLLQTADGAQRTVTADIVVFALGGASWPRVGSDGGWVTAFREDGVDVRPLRPANCGLVRPWSVRFLERHGGAPVKNVQLSAAGVVARGDLVITSAGLEGGPVYTVSSAVRDEIESAGVGRLTANLVPDLTAAQVTDRLCQRRPKDSMSTALKRSLKLSPAAVALMREVFGEALPDDVDALVRLLTALPLDIYAVTSIDRAISSAGGVSLDELDDRFMLRRRPGTFVVGEMLDWDAPTGGYLLQASFSTAVAAARGALDWLGVGQE
ncbi:MAG: TIGR03862 family flavoprotein [Actinomycetota bacterium]